MKIKNESLESSKIWLGLARFNVIETRRLLLRPFVSTDSIFCYDFINSPVTAVNAPGYDPRKLVVQCQSLKLLQQRDLFL